MFAKNLTGRNDTFSTFKFSERLFFNLWSFSTDFRTVHVYITYYNIAMLPMRACFAKNEKKSDRRKSACLSGNAALERAPLRGRGLVQLTTTNLV